MSWICRGCGREAVHIRTIVEGDQLLDQCEWPDCGNLAMVNAGIPDVFWNGRPYYSEALQCEFTSRSQKAQVMKEKGVRELGNQKLGEKNWVEGSREVRRKEFDKQKPMIRETWKKWRDTGRAR